MIAIPNMKMPKSCGLCPIDGCEYIAGKRECPLIDIVTCGECKWWDRDGDRPFGYCHAEKHCYFSTNWEISIYRTYKSDHFCSDGERANNTRTDE